MTRKCKICGTEFYTSEKNKKTLNKQTCSRSCALKLRWQNPEYRKSMSEMSKKNWDDESYRNNVLDKRKDMWTDDLRERRSLYMKEYYNDEDNKKQLSNRMKKYWTRENVKENYKNKMRDYWDSIEYKKECTERAKKRWKSVVYRKQVHDSQVIAHNKPSTIEKHRQNVSEKWKDPEYRNYISNTMKEKWKDPEYRNAVVSSQLDSWNDSTVADARMKKCFNYKEFCLPSGRIIKLQGFEPQVLTQLLQTYSEDDIVCEVKDINNEIGKILYQYEGKERRYYPDFYIKSTNTIIEVKSQWTFDKHKEKNLAKEQACLEQGFNFEFIIIT